MDIPQTIRNKYPLRSSELVDQLKYTESKKVLFNKSTKSTNSSGSNLVDYEKIIDPELVPNDWKLRHFKLIHLRGINYYLDLVDRARKFGKPPAKLLAHIVNQELNAIR